MARDVLHNSFLDCRFGPVLIDVISNLFDFLDSALKAALSETRFGMNGDSDIPLLGCLRRGKLARDLGPPSI